ncbi:MAG: PLP-dependent aspartate aminotransferase family protein [bacterium]|nr:PLP-dependent aspartate aminotransferase family protein [bacterium]
MKGNEPVAPIVVRSKTYHWPGIDADPPYKYSRGANPTRTQLENELIRNENFSEQIFSHAYASGIAAESALFLSLNPGDRVLLCDEIYGGTYRLFHSVLKRFGIECDFADLNSYEAARKKITPQTKYIFVEPISNPSLIVTDLHSVARLSKETGIPFAVDGTFSPAPALKAFEYGAETIIYSLSKYFCGHNDAIGGAVLTRNKKLSEHLKLMQTTLGATLSPDESYRIIQGMKSLEIRWKHVSQSAQVVGKWLEKQTHIQRVLYPLLPSHPQFKISKSQFKNGAGSVVSFELNFSRRNVVKKFVDAIITDGVLVFGESLASPETILAYPAIMSHRSLSIEQREALGISDGFFRLSLGFEEPEKIIHSLEKALTSVSA